jgi:hypothetical protein
MQSLQFELEYAKLQTSARVQLYRMMSWRCIVMHYCKLFGYDICRGLPRTAQTLHRLLLRHHCWSYQKHYTSWPCCLTHCLAMRATSHVCAAALYIESSPTAALTFGVLLTVHSHSNCQAPAARTAQQCPPTACNSQLKSVTVKL